MTDESPASAFERYLAEVERDPKFRARGERIAASQARRPLHPFYGGPAVGLGIVALLLIAAQVARWMGWI